MRNGVVSSFAGVGFRLLELRVADWGMPVRSPRSHKKENEDGCYNFSLFFMVEVLYEKAGESC